MLRRPIKSCRRIPLRLATLDRRDLPSAALPFADGFESGILGPNWSTSATNNGRVTVSSLQSPIAGTKQAILDCSAPGILSRSEMTLKVDLAGVSNAVLTFKEKEFNDADHDMPATFTGTSNSDGVALSVDGSNWHRIVSLVGTASQNVTQVYTYNLAKFAADRGLTLSDTTYIKFQNYGSGVAPAGGFAFDDVNITVSGTVSGRVYEDTNKDGTYQPGEPLEAGAKVYLDANNDGKLAAGSEYLVFSEQLPAPISDLKRSLYPLRVNVVDGPIISDVKVSIALAHTYAADLDISLISPSGTRVLLTSDNGGNGDNYFVTRFDDEAGVSITAGSAPFSGTYKPEGSLSAFAGESFNGVWLLEIIDDAAGDTGTLAGWSIDLSQEFSKTFNQPISDLGTSDFYLPTDPFSFYDDLDVRVNLTHANVGDLKLVLRNAINDSVVLSTFNGGTGNNYSKTVFDDQATVSITAGSAPFTGHYRPEQNLSTFRDAGLVNYNFTLQALDSKAGNVGTLQDFALIYRTTFTAGADPVLAGNPGYADRTARFFVPEQLGPIADLDVLVDVDHFNNEVLTLSLSHVGQAGSVSLTTGNSVGGQTGKNFAGTQFDDEADLAIASGVAPYTGSYRPYGKLSNFDGSLAGGEWSLLVDNAKTASGQYNWGALVLRTVDSGTDLVVRSIPDQATVTAPLTLSGLTGGIADLDVRININHTYAADLDVFLTAPNGRTVELFSDVGGNGDNFTGTVFSDEAGTAITAGAAPFTAVYRPEGLLSDFDGMDPNGTWTLTVTDDAGNDTGLLASWSLLVTTGERFDVTDANGEYSFDNLPPVSTTVRVDMNAGTVWTNPATGKRTLAVTWGSDFAGQDFGFVSDTTAPHVDLTDLSYYRNSPVASIDAVFTEPVTGVDLADFSLTFGGSAVSLIGATLTTLDNVTWTLGNLAGLQLADGIYTLSLNPEGSGIIDLATNPIYSFVTESATWKIDSVAPQIQSLTRADPEVNNLPTVRWQYGFSETVYGLAPSQFEMTGTAAAGANVVSVIGGYIYANVFNNGTLGLKMVNSVGASDAYGNPVSNLPFQGETYTIARPPVHVVGVQVNDGAAQRSMVQSLTVTFDQTPSFAGNPAAAFQLVRQSDNATVNLLADWNDTAVTLTFAGGPVQFGSLADGRYTLTAKATAIANLDGNGDGTVGDDYTRAGTPANGLFRLFGDANGDATVNSSDFLAFRLAFLSASPTFDYNGSGSVDSGDFLQFRLHFLQSV